MLIRFLLSASILIFCTPSLVSACICVLSPGSCNQDWKSGEVIFTGTVTKVTVTTSKTAENETLRQLVVPKAFQFSVSESFRGSPIAGEDVTVHTDTSDCGYNFHVGTSYLVYASLDNGKIYTNICTLTNPAAEMRHVIQQLRALRIGERVADLFGMIHTSFADDPLNVKPLAGRRVRVTGSGNSEYSTITDDEGVYSFQNLPADTYSIEVDPPPGMSTGQRNKIVLYTVEVGAQGKSGCPASVF